MPDKSKIIMCSAEPGWLYTDTNSKSWSITDFAVGLALGARKSDGTSKGHTVPILLSGDTHHYSRYQATDGTQFITSGGGGAFLHPTHHLEKNVSLDWQTTKKNLQLGAIPSVKKDTPEEPACYPSKRICQRLVWRNVFFAFKNWDFSLLMGAIYGLCGLAISLRDEWDVRIIVTAVFAWALMGYAINQEKSSGPGVLISSAIHSLAQATAVITSGHLFRLWNEATPLFPGQWFDVWLWLIRLAVEMGVVGFLVGSTLFGLNLLITCRWMRMNRNDAFSALRLGRYNNFLRLRIEGDTVDIFAVGLDDVPHRDDWIANPECPQARNDPYQPVFIAKNGLKPHLIETIRVQSSPA
ncbi:hypothetical protein N2603_42495 [Bradyrhizobium huanghuaihaiense]|uniref:hypothetical protein n=1 Tax=Bradyrhizobium huanghuaihaiense TaxID=990078 RepID=UPI0021AAE77E|nr:hypothetical protein [Bradyrhizobium sp. CB3035]UWU81612.1 hypothetical protein N2603_42495 [Bradyrhizobium sp. CB3035]